MKLKGVIDENRFNLYVDNKFFAGIFKELKYRLKLEEGTEIDTKKLQTLITEEMIYKAREKAFQILNKAPQSEKLLRDKLLKRGFEEHTVNSVMGFLKVHQFINDEDYARKLVREKSTYKKVWKKPNYSRFIQKENK